MIAATVVVDLTRDTPEGDRAALGNLAGLLPPDASIVLAVGGRTFAPPSTVAQVQQVARRTDVDVHGNLAAVVAWVAALRDPDYAYPPRF